MDAAGLASDALRALQYALAKGGFLGNLDEECISIPADTGVLYHSSAAQGSWRPVLLALA